MIKVECCEKGPRTGLWFTTPFLTFSLQLNSISLSSPLPLIYLLSRSINSVLFHHRYTAPDNECPVNGQWNLTLNLKLALAIFLYYTLLPTHRDHTPHRVKFLNKALHKGQQFALHLSTQSTDNKLLADNVMWRNFKWINHSRF